jgi:hypothetical protein
MLACISDLLEQSLSLLRTVVWLVLVSELLASQQTHHDGRGSAVSWEGVLATDRRRSRTPEEQLS